MNTDIEELFVNKYIVKQKRERILFELRKPSKRIDALSRFCHNYDTYLDERKIVKRGKKITDKELKEIVEKYGNKNKGFMICWDKRYDLMEMTADTAISIIRNDGMCALFISGDVCIISTEQIQGPKEIVILCSVH